MGIAALTALTMFPATGWVGLNLLATSNNLLGAGMAALKGASYVGSLFIASFIHQIYPSIFSYIFWLLMKLGQWYIFDVVDILDPRFSKTGFRSPFHLPLPFGLNATDGGGFSTCSDADKRAGKCADWILNIPIICLISAALLANGITWAKYLPEGAQTAFQYATGGGAGLFASGGAINAMYSAQSTASAAASQSVIPQMAIPVLKGGGGEGNGKGKGSLPPLSSFVDEIKESYSEESFDDSAPFLAILAYICAAGFGLALSRRLNP